jgi:hypothetical protein
MRRHILLAVGPLTAPAVHAASVRPGGTPARITILYGAFGGAPGLTTDWGFATLKLRFGSRYLYAGLVTVLERWAGPSGRWFRRTDRGT